MRFHQAVWSALFVLLCSSHAFGQEKIRIFNQTHLSITLAPLQSEVRYRVFLNPLGLRAPSRDRLMSYRCTGTDIEITLTRVAVRRYELAILIRSAFDLSVGFSGLAPTPLVHTLLEPRYAEYPQYAVHAELTKFERPPSPTTQNLDCSKSWSVGR